MRDYSKYFTPLEIADILIQNCEGIEPISAIDICAGSWNLLNAAKKKWPSIEITGVDINTESNNSILKDGREFAALEFEQKKYDLVLANPPFEYESPRKSIIKLINSIFSSYNFNNNIINRLESTMLLFNSILVKNGGILATIVPQSIVNAQTQSQLRGYLSSVFYVEKIIKLPSSAFGSSEIRTSILILRKEKKKKGTLVYEVESIESKYITQIKGVISNEQIINGKWELDTINFDEKIKEPSPNISIIRNRISTNLLTDRPGYPVIHSTSLTDFGVDISKLRYTKEIKPTDRPTLKGDILIVRIGKKSGQFFLITQEEEGLYISDCLMIIRITNEFEKLVVLKKLKRSISYFVKGVTVKYITQSDLNKILCN